MAPTKSLVALAVLVVGLQGTSASLPQAEAITDPDAYSIYRTLLPRMWRNHSKDPILLVIETEPIDLSCTPPNPPPEWQEVEKDFKKQNATTRHLLPTIQLEVPYRFIPRAEIAADDARLEKLYPGIWQRRPDSLEFIAVSAVGFNAAKTKAMVYVRMRSSGDVHSMERQGEQWVGAKSRGVCGWIA